MTSKKTDLNRGLRDLTDLPKFLLHPRITLAPRLDELEPVKRALLFSMGMVAVSFACASVLKVTAGPELTNLAYTTAGTVVFWFIYAWFLHGFVYVFGGRRGASRTIASYLYIAGFLQPIVVVLLYALTWISTEPVVFEDLTIGGGSGVALFMVTGAHLNGDIALAFRAIVGALILGFMAIVLPVAQSLSVVRSVFAVLTSFVFFLVGFMILLILSVPITGPLVRLGVG